LFLAIIFSSLNACRRVRKAAQRGEVSPVMAPYAIALESSLVAFIVGGSFVSFQYCEMLWHFFALSVALERVAVVESVTSTVAIENAPTIATETTAAEPDQDFVWT
jgi:hypothetical protein